MTRMDTIRFYVNTDPNGKLRITKLDTNGEILWTSYVTKTINLRKIRQLLVISANNTACLGSDQIGWTECECVDLENVEMPVH